MASASYITNDYNLPACGSFTTDAINYNASPNDIYDALVAACSALSDIYVWDDWTVLSHYSQGRHFKIMFNTINGDVTQLTIAATVDMTVSTNYLGSA